MSLRVSRAAPGTEFTTDAVGDIHLAGVRLTDAGGWIDVPRDAIAPGTTGLVTVRLRVACTDGCATDLVIDQVRVGRMHYVGVHSLAAIEGRPWLGALRLALHQCLEARLEAPGQQGSIERDDREGPASPRRNPSGSQLRATTGGVLVPVDDADADSSGRFGSIG